MTPEEKLERANRAEKLINDPLLNDAFKTLRETILENIEKAPIRDQEGVHECHLMLKVLVSLRKYFEDAVRDGKVVVYMLEQRKKLEAAQAEEQRRWSPAEYSAKHR